MQHSNESQPDASDHSITEAKEASSLEPKIDITDFAKVEVRVGIRSFGSHRELRYARLLDAVNWPIRKITNSAG